jgi:AsmA protein
MLAAPLAQWSNSRMNKLLRWVLGLAGAFILLLIVAALAVTMLVDPNDYREEIATAVEQQTGRELSIEGNLKLKLFPCCGISLGAIALGNPAGFAATPFVRVAAAAVNVQIWPLLSRQELRIGEIQLDGLDLQLISKADGSVNWEFAPAEGEPADSATQDEVAGTGLAGIDIAGVAVTNGRVSYADESTGDDILITDINLTAGAIRGGEPFEFDAALNADGLAEGIASRVELAGVATLDTLNTQLDLTDINGQIDLSGADLPGGNATVELSLVAARALGADRSAIEGLAAGISVADVKLDVAGSGALVDGAPELNGTLRVASFSPQALLKRMGEEPVVTSDPAVLQDFDLQGGWSLGANSAALDNIVASLDDSQIKGRVAVTDFATSRLQFDLQIDALDADRYLAPAEEDSSGGAAGSGSDESDTSLDLPVDDLRALDLTGRLSVGKLKIADARLQDVVVNVTAKNGLLRLNPLTANLYSGGYSGDMRLDVRGTKPNLAVDEKLNGVQIGELLSEASDMENLVGRVNARITATATGGTVNELLENLGGDAGFDLQEGAYQGMDLWYEIRKARALLKKEAAPPAPQNPVTEISQFSGTARFADGLIRNEDFTAQIPFLRVSGKGGVNLLKSTLDYGLQARVVSTPTFEDGEKLDDLDDVVLPITIQGDMNAPKVGVDLGGLAVSLGERKLRERLLKKLGGQDDDPAAEQSNQEAGQTDQQGAPQSDDPKEQLKKGLFDLLNK